MSLAELVDPLLDRVVDLQCLPQAEQVILWPAPAQLRGNLLLALVAVPVPQFRQVPGSGFTESLLQNLTARDFSTDFGPELL
jgi:hypothetical protein